MSEPVLTLRKPLARALRAGHPWVYADAVSGRAPAGTIARVVDRDGSFVGRGIADDGPIALRIFTLRDESVGGALFADRLRRAAELRDRVITRDTDAYRLVHGEGDRLPGFVCDVYGAFAVLQTDGAGATALRQPMLDVLRPVLERRGVQSLLLRTRTRRNTDEHEQPKSELLWGAAPTVPMLVHEHGMRLAVDLLQGQKTGLFLDQRESRARVRSLASQQHVLNLYSYTGGFSIAAGLGGAATVTTVDIARGAIEMAERSWSANELDAALHTTIVGDVRTRVPELQRAQRRYTFIIADPPSFAPREDAVQAAVDAYRALHASCLSLLAPGGFYLAASCSSHVDREMFEGTVLEGARRARRALQRLGSWGAPPDHPRLPGFIEGDYLKVFLYRAD